MTTGFYLAAIIGAVASFFAGCIWYTVLFGKIWQKEMAFSDDKIKKIFTPKRMLVAFVAEWIASFCTVGLFFNSPIDMIYKIVMVAVVVVFQGVKLAIFDGKTIKTIFINEGYRMVSIIIIGICYSIFL